MTIGTSYHEVVSTISVDEHHDSTGVTQLGDCPNRPQDTLIVIDSAVEDYHHLIEGQFPNTGILILAPDQDGVDQITATLAKRPTTTHLHIVAHGAPGCLYLGNTVVNSHSLKHHAQKIQQWFAGVAAPCSLLIYGCRVASGKSGAAFIETLHQITKVGVAAATTLVGNAIKGGQWFLDVVKGQPDITLPFQESALATYGHVLVAIPTLDLPDGADTGSSSSDNTTKTSFPIFKGTADANALITLYIGGNPLGTTLANSQGEWTFVPSSPLDEGTYSITATAQVEGVTSSSSPVLQLTIDTTLALTSEPDIVALSDSGKFNNDNVTNDTTPTLTGTTEAFSRVDVFGRNASGGNIFLGTTTADENGNWTLTPAGGNEAFVAGTYGSVVLIKVTDVAGNTGVAALPVNIDTVNPNKPGTPDLAWYSDYGRSNSDNVTNAKRPTVTGWAEAHSTIHVYDGENLLGTANADRDGYWTFAPSVDLNDGTHTITCTATDLAGNVSVSSDGISFEIETVKPAAPTTLTFVGTDTGRSSTDSITYDNTLTISGKAEVNSLIRLYLGGTLMGSTVTDSAGNWSITTLSSATPSIGAITTSGTYNFTATAEDLAGNISVVSDSINITVDLIAPSAPYSLDLDTNSDSGQSNSDNITKNNTPTITGIAEANSIVKLYSGSTEVGSATADSSGNWSIVTTTLSDGVHNLYAKATDVAGNVSINSNSIAITIDTTPPPQPGIPDLVTESDSGSSSTDNITFDSTPTFTGNIGANTQVQLFEGNNLLGTTTSNSSGDWTITTGTLADGNYNITLKAIDVAGNVSNASNPLNVTVDTLAPTLSLDSTSDSFVNAPFTVTANFSESVTGFDASDITCGNGTISNFSGSGSTYTFTVNPTSNGIVNVVVGASAAKDTAGLNSASAPSFSRTYDNVAPTIILSSAANPYVNGAFDVTATFSEAVTGFTSSDITISNGSVTNFNGSGNSYTFTVTPTNDGTVTIGVAGGVAQDLATNNNTAATSISRIKDSGPPTVTSVSSTQANGAYKAGDQIAITVKFSEVVYVTGIPQLTLETGTTDAIVNYSSGSGTDTLTFLYTVAVGDNAPDLDYNSASALVLNGGSIKDIANNNAALTLPSPGTMNSLGSSKSINVDALPPNAPINLSIDSASESGISLSDNLIKDNTPTIKGKAEANSVVKIYDGPTLLGSISADVLGNWTFTTGVLSDGPHVITATATDALGNVSAASTALNLTVDTSSPTVSLNTSAPNPTNAAFEVTAAFSETVNDFTASDVTVTNGTVSSFGGSGNTYSFQIAPTGNGPVSVVVNGGVAQDNAGNNNSGSTTLVRTYDGTPPSVLAVTSSQTNGSYKAGDQIAITIQFNEVVYVTGTPQLTLETGAIDAKVNYSSGSGTNTLTFLYTIASGDNTSDLEYLSTSALALNGGSIKDLAGNNGVLLLPTLNSANSLGGSKNINVDALAPNAPTTLTLDPASESGISLIDKLINDNTPTITGKAEANSTVKLYDGPTMVGEAIANASGDWTITTSALGNGEHSLIATATDALGNTSSASSPLILTVDKVAPTVILETNALAETNAPFDVMATFNESVVGFDASKVNVTNGTVDNITSAGGNSYTIRITPTEDGPVSVKVNGTVLQDQAGNDNTASNVLTRTFDGTKPIVIDVTSTKADGAYAEDAAIAIRVQFSEVVYVTGTPQLTLETGATDAVVDYIGGSGTNTLIFLYEVAPGHNTLDLDYISTAALFLNNGTIKDTAGNTAILTLPTPGTDKSLGGNKNLAIDTTAPDSPINLAIDPSSESGVSLTDKLISDNTPTLTGKAEANSTVKLYEGTTLVGSGTADGLGTWSITVDPLSDGVHNITAKATDSVGNTSSSSSPFEFTVDKAAPTVSLSTGAPANVNAPFEVTATFSETVVDFDATKLSVTNGTISNFSGSGSTYTFQVTPTNDGPVSVNIKEAEVQDEAGNNSVASNTLNFNFDKTLPTVLGVSSTKANATYKAGEQIAITVTFSEAIYVTGTPQLSLETGDTDAIASYSGGSGTDTLTFLYIVEAGENSADLDYISAIALALNGGTIKDIAGNSATLTLPDPGTANSLGGSKAIVIDTTSPDGPFDLAIDPSSESGFSLIDKLIQDTTPTITGKAEANSTVKLYDGTTEIGSTTADASGNWSITASTLGDGAHSLTATSTDRGGNISNASPTLAVTVDSTAPSAPSRPELDSGTDSGRSSNDSITNQTTLTFRGSAEKNSKVELFRGDVSLGIVDADSNGQWSFSVNNLAEGSYTITAKATDAAGNTSLVSDPLTLVVDRSAPAAPVIKAIAEDSGTSSTDAITSDHTLALSGTAEAKAKVNLFMNGFFIGTTDVDNDGKWTFNHEAELSDGTYSYTATATDIAGNTSTLSTTFTAVVDTTAPIVGLSTSAADSVNAPFTVNAKFNEAVVDFDASDIVLQNATLSNFSGSGTTYSFTVTPTSTGLAVITVKSNAVQDLAGNTNTATQISRTYDLTPPPKPTNWSLAPGGDSEEVGDNITNINNITLMGEAEANSTIQIYNGTALLGTTQVDAEGKWSFSPTSSITKILDGDYQISLKAIDAAGNASELSDASTLRIDTLAPRGVLTSVTPNLRDSAVPSITLTFNEVVKNLDLSDLTLTRDGNVVSWGGATLKTDDGITWQLGNLTALTTRAGEYMLSLKSADITDLAGNSLRPTTSIEWRTDYTGEPLPAISFTGLKLLGRETDDTLSGGYRNDQLYGGDGNDTLTGGLNDDLLVGGDGNDEMNGGSGDDVLLGGSGRDILVGESGRDTFVYRSFDDEGDIVRDFSVRDDLIDLRSIFNETKFSAVNQITQFERFVRLTQVGTSTQVQVDSNGNSIGRAFVTLLTLQNTTADTLSAANFLI